MGSCPSPQHGHEQRAQHPQGARRPGQFSPLRSTPAYRAVSLAALLTCAPPAFAGDELPNPDAEEAAIGLVWRLYDTEGPERAEQFLQEWVATHPDAVDARLLRARMASWTGRFPEARAEIEHARDLAPDSPQVEVTRAGVELLAGRPGEAARAVRAAQGIDPRAEGLADVAGLLGDATRPWAAGTTTFASETSGIDRTTASAGLVSWVTGGTTLDVAVDVASFRSADDAFFRSGVGGRIAQELPLDFRLDLGLSAQWVAGHPVQPRWNAEVAWSFPGVGSVGLGVRRRAVVDDPVVHGTALPPLVGTAGAAMDDIALGLDQDEAFLRVSVVPVRPVSVWLEASGGAIDGNRRASLSAGAIWDVLAATGGPHVLGVRYELYVLSFAHAVPDYYSPQGANSHAPGLEWHWTTDAGHQIVALAAPILQPGGPPGEMLGVSARFHVARRLDFGLGLRHQGNKHYRITGATTSLEGRL